MNQITPQIWIGNSHSAAYQNPLIQEGIKFILNCAEDLPEQLDWNDGMTVFHCGMRDSENHPELYRAAVHILSAVTSRLENKILVHCHEGRSRSVYVVACHLVQKKIHPDIDSAIDFIRQCGRDVKVADGHRKSFQP